MQYSTHTHACGGRVVVPPLVWVVYHCLCSGVMMKIERIDYLPWTVHPTLLCKVSLQTDRVNQWILLSNTNECRYQYGSPSYEYHYCLVMCPEWYAVGVRPRWCRSVCALAGPHTPTGAPVIMGSWHLVVKSKTGLAWEYTLSCEKCSLKRWDCKCYSCMPCTYMWILSVFSAYNVNCVFGKWYAIVR